MQPMTDDEFGDYKAHPHAYFGKILPVSRKVENQYELFEFLVEANRGCLARRSWSASADRRRIRTAQLAIRICSLNTARALVAAVPDLATNA
jgi:hypothetical protein